MGKPNQMNPPLHKLLDKVGHEGKVYTVIGVHLTDITSENEANWVYDLADKETMMAPDPEEYGDEGVEIDPDLEGVEEEMLDGPEKIRRKRVKEVMAEAEELGLHVLPPVQQ